MSQKRQIKKKSQCAFCKPRWSGISCNPVLILTSWLAKRSLYIDWAKHTLGLGCFFLCWCVTLLLVYCMSKVQLHSNDFFLVHVWQRINNFLCNDTETQFVVHIPNILISISTYIGCLNWCILKFRQIFINFNWK